MNWWDKFMEWSWQREANLQFEEAQKENKAIDIMKDDVDPNEVTIENAYKTRWIWYHTILGIELLIVILIQLAILIVLAVKL